MSAPPWVSRSRAEDSSQRGAFALQIHETIEYINQLKTERDFMLSFSNNPQEFIQDWLKSQCRDLKVTLASEPRDGVGGSVLMG